MADCVAFLARLSACSAFIDASKSIDSYESLSGSSIIKSLSVGGGDFGGTACFMLECCLLFEFDKDVERNDCGACISKVKFVFEMVSTPCLILQ